MSGAVFLGARLGSRSVLASGILGVTLSSLRRAHREGAGAVTTKSVGPERRKGHRGPVVHDWGVGLINAVGLSGAGVEGFLAEWEGAEVDFPLILSVFGGVEGEFAEVAARLERLGHAFLELNISCPNVLDEFGSPFSFSPELTYRITRSVKDATRKPVIVKLSPNTPLVKRVAKSAEEGGADALCVMNTAGPGMVIDTAVAAPVIGNKRGGLSGEAVLPLTVRHVYDLYTEVKVPIIGTGGVGSADGALQVMMAGASLYGVGSAVARGGLPVFKEIDRGIEEFVEKNGFADQGDIVGLAHRENRRRFYAAPATREGGRPSRFRVLPVEEVLGGGAAPVRTLLFRHGGGTPLGEGGAGVKPGQFFMLWLPGVDQKPYSVSLCREGFVGFSLQTRGAFSAELMGSKRGEPVGLLGPLGSSFALDEPGPYLLVGGGIGLAPLAFAASRLAARGERAVIFAGARSEPYVSWIHELIRGTGGEETGGPSPAPGIEFLCCTEDGSSGASGQITEHLERVIDTVRPARALLCGPELFMAKAVETFRRRGIPGEASVERMMKCGIGVCGSCSLDDTGDRVCVEGPVFGFDYLAGLSEFGRYERDESGTRRRFDQPR